MNLLLAQAKNGDKQFVGNRSKFVQLIRRLSMHSWESSFFSFGQGGVGERICLGFRVYLLQCIPIMGFPKLLPKMLPIAPQIYLICFAQSWKGGSQWSTFCFYFATWVQRGAYIGEITMFPTFFGDGQINMAHSRKTKREMWAHHLLIKLILNWHLTETVTLQKRD